MYCVNSQSDSFGRRILTYNFRVDLLWSYYYFCVKMRLKDSTPMSFHVALVCSRRLNQLWNYFPDSLFLSHHWQWADALHCCWGAFCMEVSLLYVPSGAGVLLDFFSSVLDRALRFRVVMKGKLDVMKTACCPRQPGPWWQELVGCPVGPGWIPTSHKVLLPLGRLFKKCFAIVQFTQVLLMLDKLTLGGHQGNFR